jgi:hypothetical protein
MALSIIAGGAKGQERAGGNASVDTIVSSRMRLAVATTVPVPHGGVGAFVGSWFGHAPYADLATDAGDHGVDTVHLGASGE